MEMDAKLLARIDRADFLNRHPPQCPKCDTFQVQIKGSDIPALWRCRVCKHWFTHEPKTD